MEGTGFQRFERAELVRGSSDASCLHGENWFRTLITPHGDSPAKTCAGGAEGPAGRVSRRVLVVDPRQRSDGHLAAAPRATGLVLADHGGAQGTCYGSIAPRKPRSGHRPPEHDDGIGGTVSCSMIPTLASKSALKPCAGPAEPHQVPLERPAETERRVGSGWPLACRSWSSARPCGPGAPGSWNSDQPLPGT
jgi:hypothetical protein